MIFGPQNANVCLVPEMWAAMVSSNQQFVLQLKKFVYVSKLTGACLLRWQKFIHDCTLFCFSWQNPQAVVRENNFQSRIRNA